MTAKLEAQPKSSLQTLRAALEQAERQLTRLNGSTIKAFLMQLDQIEQMFSDLGGDENALRAEAGRWLTLRNRIEAKPQLLLNAAAQAGGLAKMRSQHPPATGPWWHVDSAVANRRAQLWKRTGMVIAAVVVVGALALWAINAVTPAAESPTNATTQIEQLVTAQKLPDALAVVEKARQTTQNDPELLIWDAVLNEQLGHAVSAKISLAQAQQKFVGQPAAFWTLVGTHRQQVGNLKGAEQAGQQALALAPQDAAATFLLGSVAEARGDTLKAAAFFSKTVALAGNGNAQLGVIAKMRMGNMVAPAAGAAPVPTLPLTATIKAP